MTTVRAVPAAGESLWVGMLEFDQDVPVTAISGPVQARHGQARILIRRHRAPVGFVTIPAEPAATMADRARAAARIALGEPLRQHASWDAEAAAAPQQASWAARVACPDRQPATGDGISVVICSRDRAASLARSVRAVQQVGYQPLEILVVDNAPTTAQTRRAVAELAAADPRVRYTREPAPGLSRARNHGLAQAAHDIVAFTDDDVLADPGWPAAIAAGFAADPQTVCVTGPVPAGSLDTSAERYFESRYTWGTAFAPRRFDLARHRDRSRLYPFSAGLFGTGASLAVRRAAVLDAGGFDPLLGAGSPARGGEDLDIFVRLILASGRLSYLPSALVWHRHRAETGELSEQIYSYGFGLGAYLAKHLLDRTLPAGMLAHGLAKAASVAKTMRQATQDSQLHGDGRRLAVREVSGMLAGVAAYSRARRAARR